MTTPLNNILDISTTNTTNTVSDNTTSSSNPFAHSMGPSPVSYDLLCSRLQEKRLDPSANVPKRGISPIKSTQRMTFSQVFDNRDSKSIDKKHVSQMKHYLKNVALDNQETTQLVFGAAAMKMNEIAIQNSDKVVRKKAEGLYRMIMMPESIPPAERGHTLGSVETAGNDHLYEGVRAQTLRAQFQPDRTIKPEQATLAYQNLQTHINDRKITDKEIADCLIDAIGQWRKNSAIHETGDMLVNMTQSFLERPDAAIGLKKEVGVSLQRSPGVVKPDRSGAA